MKKRAIEYYYWSDVENFLKEQLPHHFDVREIWADLTWFPGNDESMITHSLHYMMKDSHGEFINCLIAKKYSKKDTELIFRAMRKLEEYCGNEITIYYSW